MGENVNTKPIACALKERFCEVKKLINDRKKWPDLPLRNRSFADCYKKPPMGKTTKTTIGTIIAWIGPVSLQSFARAVAVPRCARAQFLQYKTSQFLFCLLYFADVNITRLKFTVTVAYKK